MVFKDLKDCFKDAGNKCSIYTCQIGRKSRLERNSYKSFITGRRAEHQNRSPGTATESFYQNSFKQVREIYVRKDTGSIGSDLGQEDGLDNLSRSLSPVLLFAEICNL